MARRRALTIDDLWKLERLGPPSLSPDGAFAVCALTRHSMADNRARSVLWLLPTGGEPPRPLTQAGDKDGQPRCSPRGRLVGFVARREHDGRKDETPQFYLIPADGGEARRIGEVATGIEAFRWFPDGRRVAFVSWVWPELRGARAQARRFAEWQQRRHSGIATSDAIYRHWDHFTPPGRVPHLHVMDVTGPRAGRVRDLFEGSAFELQRAEPGADDFDISPDGRRIAFAHDPAADKRLDGRFAITEIELDGGAVRERVRDAGWSFDAPRYSPDGDRLALLASHQARKHTMPQQLAVWERESGRWDVVSAEWDHAPKAPLRWEDDGQALLFAAEQQGRCHLWRFDLPDRRAERVVAGGTVQAFDKAAELLVTLADAADHPARLHAHAPGEAPRRLERFNDALLAGIDLGRCEERWFRGADPRPASAGGGAHRGAAADEVQMWVFYPPGFDARRRWPILHAIHGGPHTGPGDQWHYRWCWPLLAAQGYVVVNVNYHGSSGFGYAFLDSISHRYGELELADLEAATDALLDEPWADPRRVFAAGGSYGGYLVAWMNAHLPRGRYAALVCHAGCFDWTAMFADDAYEWHAKELGAFYWDAPERVQSQSPHAFAAGMQTPTLVTHGALDYRVPDAQGLAFYNTLKARRVEARLLWFPDENHWITKPRNSRQWYEEVFAWLARHDAAA